MSKKKILFVSILFIIIIFFIIYFCIANSQEDVDISIEELYDKIVENNETIVSIVNQEEITDKDIFFTQYYSHENDEEKAKELTIEKVVLLQEINEKNIELNQEEQEYINNLVKGLGSGIETKGIYSENEKEEILTTIYEKLYNNNLIIQYEYQIISEIADKTFNPKNDVIEEAYNKYLEIQNKWDNNEGISYGELLNAREEFWDIYVEDLLSNAVIEWK